jgi:hypothetical protein
MAKRTREAGTAKGKGKQRATPASIALIVSQNRMGSGFALIKLPSPTPRPMMMPVTFGEIITASYEYSRLTFQETL